MQLTDHGAQAATYGEAERAALLAQLVNGAAEISDYTNGICYDTVAFCLYLDGRFGITPDQLIDTYGQDWVSVLGLDGGTVWQGEGLAAGYGVGFRRIGTYSPGFFHAALAIGGTEVRGVNAHGLTPGWSATFDLSGLPVGDDGTYWYDNQPIEVCYV